MQTLRTIRIDGVPVLDTASAADARYFASFDAFGRSTQWKPLAGGLETRESVLSRIPDARVITDDNMLPEVRKLLLFQ
jgi:hypothetical protein